MFAASVIVLFAIAVDVVLWQFPTGTIFVDASTLTSSIRICGCSIELGCRFVDFPCWIAAVKPNVCYRNTYRGKYYRPFTPNTRYHINCLFNRFLYGGHMRQEAFSFMTDANSFFNGALKRATFLGASDPNITDSARATGELMGGAFVSAAQKKLGDARSARRRRLERNALRQRNERTGASIKQNGFAARRRRAKPVEPQLELFSDYVAKVDTAEAKGALGDDAAIVKHRQMIDDPLIDQLPQRRLKVQWFPSFARRALIPLRQHASTADLILEVRDARLPQLTEYPIMLSSSQKPVLTLFTHADRADPLGTRSWQRHLREKTTIAAALQLKNILEGAEKKIGNAHILSEVIKLCRPLPPPSPFLFSDLRRTAARIALQRAARLAVNRHRHFRENITLFQRIVNMVSEMSFLKKYRGNDEMLSTGENTNNDADISEFAQEEIFNAVQDILRKDTPPIRNSLRRQRPIRVLVVGVPNVGKSAAANALLDRTAARSFRWPGVTTTINVHRSKTTPFAYGKSRIFDVIDTPGILPHSASNSVKKKKEFWGGADIFKGHELSVGRGRLRKLSLSLFFKESLVPTDEDMRIMAALHLLPLNVLFCVEEPAVALLQRLADGFLSSNSKVAHSGNKSKTAGMSALMKRYKWPLEMKEFKFLLEEKRKEGVNLGVFLLHEIARLRHCSEVDKAAQRVLGDISKGYLSGFTLEFPPQSDTSNTPKDPKELEDITISHSQQFDQESQAIPQQKNEKFNLLESGLSKFCESSTSGVLECDDKRALISVVDNAPGNCEQSKIGKHNECSFVRTFGFKSNGGTDKYPEHPFKGDSNLKFQIQQLKQNALEHKSDVSSFLLERMGNFNSKGVKWDMPVVSEERKKSAVLKLFETVRSVGGPFKEW